ncbi:hypothetical protein SDC9_170306 [bioreactor metagenome]|uniref:Uncharacterized protein n=1 Tax=bioreactor metagenome TaxID=1076179 RepID=A0A645G7P7_9ZZZZ
MPVAVCFDGHQNLGARRELAGLLNVVSYRIEIDVDMCDVQHPCMLAPRNRAGFVTARAGRQDRRILTCGMGRRRIFEQSEKQGQFGFAEHGRDIVEEQ